MSKAAPFNYKEQRIVMKLDEYFKGKNMSFSEQVFNALLIASHDLEAHHFSNENERLRILEFKQVLENLWHKIN
ncbi:MAG: hypothetical protein ACOX0E_10075 [Syntrophomonadaceae bacterium]